MIQVEGFNVRIVTNGMAYGRDDCLTHDGEDALVEFYDAKHTEKFGRRGQFISRYYITTLLGCGHHIGLCLDGGVPEWSISTKGLKDVQRYLRGFLLEQ